MQNYLQDKSLLQLKKLMADLGEKQYRAEQLFTAIHRRLITNINQINHFSYKLRAVLESKFCPLILKTSEILKSSDGTRKYTFETSDGFKIESVFIPNVGKNGRNTLCISSQVGCGMSCKFCATGHMKFIRNLSTIEIIEQVYKINRDLFKNRNFNLKNDKHTIHNLVYMGMGEPLHNYCNVVKSIWLLCSQEGQNYSGRRITVSTCGIVKNITKLAVDTNVNIAVSINAADNKTRNSIMPINKKWNLEALIDACKKFTKAKHRRITFEYVILAGINDSADDAHRLIKLVRDIKSKVNLIPFNEHKYSIFKKPKTEQVKEFQNILLKHNLAAFIRETRGDDINAACGMLNQS